MNGVGPDEITVEDLREQEIECATEAVARVWGKTGRLTRLDGEADATFRVDVHGAPSFVFKVSPPSPDLRIIRLESAILEALHASSSPSPTPLPRRITTSAGEAASSISWVDGEVRLARALTWLEGRALALSRPAPPGTFRGLGALLGHLSRELKDLCEMDLPAAHLWDPLEAGETAETRLPCISGPNDRALIEQLLDRFRPAVEAARHDVPRGVIHGDPNDWNVLLSDPKGDVEGPWGPVCGLIDLGDAMETALVGDLAIAVAYGLLDEPDPLSVAASLVAGYDSQRPLSTTEIDLIWPLSLLRLCASVTISAERAAAAVDHPYLRISERSAWIALRALSQVPSELVSALLRKACGRDGSAAGAGLSAWLIAHRDDFVPLMSLGGGRMPQLEVVRSSPGESALWADPHQSERARRRSLRARLGGNGAEQLSERRTLQSAERVQELLNTTKAQGSRQCEMLGVLPPGDAWAPSVDPEPPNQKQSAQEDQDTALQAGIGAQEEDYGLPPAGTQPMEGSISGLGANTIRIGAQIVAPSGTTIHAPYPGIIERMEAASIVLRHSPPDGDSFRSRVTGLDRNPGLILDAEVDTGSLLGTVPDDPDAPLISLQVLCSDSPEPPLFTSATLATAWTALSPDPWVLMGADGPLAAAPTAPTEALMERRNARLGPMLSLSYRTPLHIVRGAGSYLFDADGRDYLDCVNNVAHVGHEHPAVVEAGTRQMGLLNTNTRYLHPLILEYADRLADTLPLPLEVIFLVCSGSEANELALRLARAASGGRGVVVLDGAYHGNTGSLTDVSPYKFNGNEGDGCPKHVQIAPMPDDYRGPYRRSDAGRGKRYSEAVSIAFERLDDAGVAPSAFLYESLPSCAGQLELPPGYLFHAQEAAHAAGAVCISDEVQVGFGRVGTHFWGFQTHDIVPDIVTMGKPIGNGHPLGAVATTRAIAEAFDTGMEYFNTFGGNPVSCAIGLSVLDVIAEEQLQENARITGAYLLKALRQLASQHVLIGDVRGRGLFLGIEFVQDRDTLEPAADEAMRVVEAARGLGVLLSTDGPLHNVVKIKPPMVFGIPEADRLVAALDRALNWVRPA